MPAIPELFSLASRAHQARNLPQATSLCRQILEQEPEHANTLNLLGVIEHQSGRIDRAIEFISRAIAANPDDGTFHYNLGVAYQLLRRNPDAIASYRQALRLLPDHGDAHHNLALVLRDENKVDEAILSFRRAAQLQPNNAVYQSDLANYLVTQGRAPEALPVYEQALRLEPEEPAHHSNLANVLILVGRPDEAEAHCRTALERKPDLANALHNLAIALGCQGRLDEAIDFNRRALQVQPDHSGARNCEALWLLQKGDFDKGWREYKARWDLPGAIHRDFPQPIWDGSPLHGRTILLHAEQGLGDTIQFIRYANLVKERGGRVIVECQPALIRLLQSCAGIDQLVARDAPLPPFDVHVPLLDLPRIFHTKLDTVPCKVPYLAPTPELLDYWRQDLKKGPALAIGIGWQGNPNFPGDRLRSIALKHFTALGKKEGIRLFSLQKGAGRDQLAGILPVCHVTDLGGRLDEAAGAFMDTAAVMKSLDLVITSDTAIAHLAGALGVPVWVALGVGADWRFLEHREDSPWYPTMRLFRQKRLHEWGELFERIVAELPTQDKSPSPAAVAQLWAVALVHFQAGRLAEAERACHQLLETEPCHAEAHNLLGVLAHQAGKNESAVEHLDRAIQLSPADAGFHYNRGVALQMLHRDDEAAVSYEHALRCHPNHADAHHNRGFILAQTGKLREAEIHYRTALRLLPNHTRAHNNYGLLLWEQNRVEEAALHFREAVRVWPEATSPHHNLGLALVNLGQVEEGLASFERVLQVQPESPETRYCRSMVLLLKGDFVQGWKEYEWRWKSLRAPKQRHHNPTWDGSPLAGRTILLFAEQGFGDTIQFIRYAPLVKERGGRVVVECPVALVSLLSRCAGIDQVVARDEPLPKCDVQAALMSLPRIFGTTLNNIPATVPYLAADPELTKNWRRELGELKGYKVGIAWQGSVTHQRDASRSIPLSQFAPLAQIPGVQLISLQKGRGSEQLETVAEQFTVVDPEKLRNDASSNFRDAAIVANLDLVITCDTSVAHLAGALGVPVWVALPLAPDWRWLLGRDDSPWYPTMRLFRQTEWGKWGTVFAQMAAELKKRLGVRAHPGAIRVEIATGELIDKITILEIKSERITNHAKLTNIRTELEKLTAERDRAIEPSGELASLTAELKKVNEQLWDIEDEIRVCEGRRDFGMRFITLARSVYQQNDRRAALKRQLNDLLGSEIVEEKSYAPYAPSIRRATVCILTFGDYLPYFKRCLDSVLATTPLDAIELRLGLNDAPASLAYARQRLRLGEPTERRVVNGQVEQLSFFMAHGMPVRVWSSPENLFKEPMARLLYHDVPLATEYAIWLDDDSFVEEGWWQALLPVLERKVDYIGQRWWVDYLPGQTAMIQAQPWYRGVPFDTRLGMIGTWFMTGGFVAVRSERLRAVNFPDTDSVWKGDTLRQYGGDTLLGEIARQQAWTWVEHDAHIKVNVDLHGNYPAPRRGPTSRQFGSEVDVTVV